MKNNYTYIDEAGVYICNDCGAFSTRITEIKHYKTCTPGDADKWENHYNEEEALV